MCRVQSNDTSGFITEIVNFVHDANIADYSLLLHLDYKISGFSFLIWKGSSKGSTIAI